MKLRIWTSRRGIIMLGTSRLPSHKSQGYNVPNCSKWLVSLEAKHKICLFSVWPKNIWKLSGITEIERWQNMEGLRDERGWIKRVVINGKYDIGKRNRPTDEKRYSCFGTFYHSKLSKHILFHIGYSIVSVLILHKCVFFSNN